MCREELRIFHRTLFDFLRSVANVSLEGDVRKQAGVPVRFGGLGCRIASDIALPSFLASKNSVGELVEIFNNITDIFQRLWCLRGGVPCSMTRDVRRTLDLPIVKKNGNIMLRNAYQVSRARILATAQKESMTWLNDLLVSSPGTLLDSESFRVDIALRVDADVCIPHSCVVVIGLRRGRQPPDQG